MNAIVMTTINPPTEAVRRFAKIPDYRLYVVGDLRTPHHLYESDPNLRYISPAEQEDKYAKLSSLIGWNCIQRRNIGYIEAFRDGAEIIASVDDDNIPYDGWGSKLLVGKTAAMQCYDSTDGMFDPLWPTNARKFWHRGFPLEFVVGRENNTTRVPRQPVYCRVQADLWDGKPDIDAVARVMYSDPSIAITGPFPFASKCMTVFNSQNTFIHRSLFPSYSVLAGADRMDDIWGGLLMQHICRDELPFIVFGKPSVLHDRNWHDAKSDMAREMPGTILTARIAQEGANALPDASLRFYEEYAKWFT